MIIQNSNVQFKASSERTEYYSKSESAEFWSGEKSSAQNVENESGVVLDLGTAPQKSVVYSQKPSSSVKSSFDFSDKHHAEIITLQTLIELLTGKKFHFANLDLDLSGSSSSLFPMSFGAASAPTPANGGWGLIVDSQEYYEETESVSFEGSGSLQCADGRSIDFSVSLSMSHAFSESNHFTLRAGEARLCDPLVINFDAASAALSDKKFCFDLDADGKSDQLSSLLGGSGFLALDKNGDGTINDGNELFGVQSGNGFSDLAAYDKDQNQWIDENDPIFDKLRIWVKDENGNSKLFALGEKGIGAIYLGNVATEYGYKTQANEINGQLRSTGVFLRENGTAGTMQHIDMAI